MVIIYKAHFSLKKYVETIYVFTTALCLNGFTLIQLKQWSVGVKLWSFIDSDWSRNTKYHNLDRKCVFCKAWNKRGN